MPTVLRTSRYSHTLTSEPNPNLDGRKLPLVEGRALGGSTVVNGMGYVRGHPADYDGWAAAGCEGWAYADVLPYFKKAESHADRRDDFHGGAGPLRVQTARNLGLLQKAFLAAGAEAGYNRTSDFSGAEQEGFGLADRTVGDGRRSSTASAYIRPAQQERPNLTVMADTDVLGLRFDGDRAVGVRARRRGAEFDIDAAGEVILSGGAYSSPQLLLLAGIGPADELAELGITPRLDRPGVGRNLKNHIDISVQYANLTPTSLLPLMRFPGKYIAGLQWMLFRTGPAASNQADVGAFIRSSSAVNRPDVKFMLTNIAMKPGTLEPYDDHSFEVHVNLLRPRSRGYLRLGSRDPLKPPVITLNYLDEPADRQAMRSGIRAARALVRQAALKPFAGEELSPGPDAQSDADLDRWIKARVRSLYHQCGTCRMGPADDPETVVDSRLRVVGVRGLRVADASIMPDIVAGNTVAPTIMIGEKAADMILADA